MAQTRPATATRTRTNGPRCPGCQQRDATIAALRQRLAQQEQELQRLRERAGRTSRNSSQPPSSDPLDAPKTHRTPKDGCRRPRGAQDGHPPAQRPLVPVEQLSEAPVDCIPVTCAHCAAALSGTDAWASRQQVIELPPIQPEIREYRRHTLTCPHCGEATRSQLPEGVADSAFGPRLQAFIGLCTGCYHLSKRQTAELLTTALNVPISVGSISRMEQRLSAALAAPVAEAHAALQQAKVVHADETSWSQQPDKSWLWLGVTTYLAVFLLSRRRDLDSAKALLGADFAGIVVTDRLASYHWLRRRQLCWAHLRRDWQAFVDRGGGSRRLGRKLLKQTREMFALWRRVRDGTLSRWLFRYHLIAIQDEIGALLRQGTRCAHAKTAGTCREILKLESALWTFVREEGVEPTNNAAERTLRPAVLWRKKSFGTRSAAGSRYVERILTVVATCRLQGRNVLEYITSASEAAIRNQPAPTLLPTGRSRSSAKIPG